MLCVAFIVGIILALRAAPAGGVKQDYLYDLFIMAIILSLIGSRLAYVLLNWEIYSGEPWQKIFAFREGGLTFLGGLILPLAGAILYCRYRKINFFHYVDFLTPYVALGYAITRIGCFLNGCCYGKVTDVHWGVVFPAVDGFHRHPTQLYASAAVFIIFLLLCYLRKRKTFHGFVFAHFILFYGIYRFIIEFYRVDAPVLGFMTPGQIASVVLIIAGGLFLHYSKNNNAECRMQNAELDGNVQLTINNEQLNDETKSNDNQESEN